MADNKMGYSLGLDIGSVNAKLALADENGIILHLDAERIAPSPALAVNSLLRRMGEYGLERITGAGVSGSGRSAIPKELGWGEFSTSLAIATGLLRAHPDARTIVQIGGQTSHIIELEDGLAKPWKVVSNPLCAAGTGRFIEQQAYRLGISMEDFARLALQCEGAAPRIAGRCSVFAKTDLIHLQQKGVPLPAMLYALCESTARMVASLKKGPFQQPVYFTGGVAANDAIVKALNAAFSARNQSDVRVIIPENSLHTQAAGTAWLSSGNGARVCSLPETESKRYFEMPGLDKGQAQEGAVSVGISGPCLGYLGVDIGSTSTKAVVLDESGTKVLAKSYVMTAGRPVDAVREVFRNLLRDNADKVIVLGAGITGSGRYLVGSFIGADLVKNEITAQTRAAAEIDPDADIIEIGGQDSKLVIKRNGVVIDYQMNKACAAGTGSFIDELAEMLSINVKSGDFADLAFQSSHTIDCGARCAAFMSQTVATAQQEGVPQDVLTASLSNSIARNYLSKVVGNRKLGNKVILTGAVFYNEAVVAAFRQQLPDKSLKVAPHKEVTGAIGAALLAKEEGSGQGSTFKGFQAVVDAECRLTTFVCKACDNNCTITRMNTEGQKPTFYGSRCDRYDSTLSADKAATLFDEREKLLFREYREGAGAGPLVGIPKALLVYDWAPLLLGFLNDLGVRVVLSSRTTSDIVAKATELSYTDSCFPLKLLHGHAASLAQADYILFPSAIRLGEKEGDENQKYACPLVQASPYIVRQALGLGDRLLTPTLDFSRGDDDTIASLADVAVKMGFSRKEGKRAALAGIAAQRRFLADQAAVGKKLLEELAATKQLGVVLFARSYMSQDSGANLGIAEKLGQLGVVAVPLDFLPIASVDPKEYTDRPYWFYESKQIAGATLTARDPQLYGLILTNFGCGPNSFILRIVEDIMGGKPLGQLEIDEHAAEAGLVTRLEAFVDTIRGFARSSQPKPDLVPAEAVYRGTTRFIMTAKTLLIPRMSPHARIVASSFEACGVKALVLAEADERSLLLSNQVTSGQECVPYRITLGDFMRFCQENGPHLKEYEGFMAGAYGPCRFGKYAIEQMRALKEMGFDLRIRTTESSNAYRDLNLGTDFERIAWKGIVAVDHLQRLLWRTRPYEKTAGEADRLFEEYMVRLEKRICQKAPLEDLMRDAAASFMALVSKDLPRRPVVGINGEIFLRSNTFSNNDVVRQCEDAGLEVVVSSGGEWLKYTTYRKVEDALRERNLKKLTMSYLRKLVQDHDERTVAAPFDGILDPDGLSTRQLLKLSSPYLSAKCGSEAVLSIGSGIEWIEKSEYSGVISVMPHGCMPGGIVAAMTERFSSAYHKPWISLTYDGFAETSNLARIRDFAEVIKYTTRRAAAERAG